MSSTPAELTSGERAAVLSRELTATIGQGRRVEARSDSHAVVITGRAVNHVMHMVLSMLSCTAWIPVWLTVALAGGERRTIITVDEYGRVDHRQDPVGVGRLAVIVSAGVAWLAVVFLGLTGVDLVATALGSR